MGAMSEISGEGYEGIRQQLDRVGVLREDLRKKQMPQATPYLLLNYLQN